VQRVLRDNNLRGHGLSYVASEALELLARFTGIDLGNESSYDSDKFPKVVLRYQCEDTNDTCEDCGRELTDVSENAAWNMPDELDDLPVDFISPEDVAWDYGPKPDRPLAGNE